MEHKNELILIDKYLSGEMSTEEQLAFLQAAETNPILGKMLAEYEQTLFQLNKKWVGSAWKAAALKWLLIKTAAIIILSVGLIASAVIIHKNISHADKNNEIGKNSIQRSINDSMAGDKTIAQIPDSATATKTMNMLVDTDNFYCKGSLKNQRKPSKKLPLGNIDNADNSKKATLDSVTDLFASNTISEATMAAYLSLKQLHFKVLDNAQVFQVNTSIDEVVKGVKGINVAIPANAFVSQNNLPIKGEVTIKLKEFVTAYDMFENGIGTNSTVGLLSSGGSCYIMAYQNGEELKIAPDKLLAIDFPSEYNPLMQTFYGSNTDTGVIWRPETKAEMVAVSTNKVADANMFIFDNKDRQMFTDAVRYDRSQSFGFQINPIHQSNGKKDEAIAALIFDSFAYKKAFQYFNPFVEFDKKLAYKMYQDQEKLEGDTLRVHYKINESGELYEYNIGKAKNKKGKRKLKRFVKKQGKSALFEQWNKGEYAFTLELTPKVVLSALKECQITTDSMLKDSRDLNAVIATRRNRITIRNLGLVNCDALRTNTKFKPVNFSSSEPEGFMYVFCKGDNSLYRTGLNTTMGFKFMQRLDIIAIIPRPDGLKMCLMENLRAKDEIKLTDNFEEFDPQKVKAILN